MIEIWMQKSLNHSSGTVAVFESIGVIGISIMKGKDIGNVDILLKSGPNIKDCNKSVS